MTGDELATIATSAAIAALLALAAIAVIAGAIQLIAGIVRAAGTHLRAHRDRRRHAGWGRWPR